ARCGNSLLLENQSTSQLSTPSVTGSFFRRPPAPPTLPSPLPTYKAKTAQDAVVRRQLLWGVGALSVLLLLLALASLVSMWMFLVPLGVICLTAMVIGLSRALQNRGLPYLPKTRRVHSLLLILVAPLLFIVAFDRGPKTFEQQQIWNEIKLANERAENESKLKKLEKDRRFDAQITCQIYLQNRLQAPSSATFSRKSVIDPRSEGGYLVAGFVDAQNAFGVKLRRNYVCAVDSAGRVINAGLVE